MWPYLWEPTMILLLTGLWNFLLKHSAGLRALVGARRGRTGIIWAGMLFCLWDRVLARGLARWLSCNRAFSLSCRRLLTSQGRLWNSCTAFCFGKPAVPRSLCVCQSKLKSRRRGLPRVISAGMKMSSEQWQFPKWMSLREESSCPCKFSALPFFKGLL